MKSSTGVLSTILRFVKNTRRYSFCLEMSFSYLMIFVYQGVVCSLFDKAAKVLADMRVGDNRCDKEYSLRARKALVDSLDSTSLCYLSQFVPNLLLLIDDIDAKMPHSIEANLSQWKLVFLLCQFLNALLNNDRPIMLILDDLQWAESLILELVLGELLECVGDGKNTRRFLFVGLYRDNEVSDGHPLHAQLVRLRNSASVNVTEICLPAFSKGDMSDMIAAELRLPT